MYGDDRHIKDFLYIYDGLTITRILYVSDISFEAALNYAHGITMILCMRKDEIDIPLHFYMGYLWNWFWAEDFFTLLDFDWKDIAGGREILLWGTGTECSYLEERSIFSNGENVFAYVDSSSEKRGQFRHGRVILNPTDITDWKRFHIIITSLKYELEIREELLKHDLVEGIDFSVYSRQHLFGEGEIEEVPSEMMKRMFYSDPVFGPKCIYPFSLWVAQVGGTVQVCICPPWAPQGVIGNMTGSTCEEIWNGIDAKIRRLSIINRTYIFCNMELCRLPKINNTDRFENIKVDSIPTKLYMCHSEVCNLQCRQCRTHKIVEDSDFAKAAIPVIFRRLYESGYINKAKTLYILGSGEALMEKESRDYLLSHQTGRRKDVLLKTNGTMLNSEIFDKLFKSFKEISISLSVDAASEQTYKKLRGGNWYTLKSNIEMLAQKRIEGKIVFLSSPMLFKWIIFFKWRILFIGRNLFKGLIKYCFSDFILPNLCQPVSSNSILVISKMGAQRRKLNTSFRKTF